jgi:hypothetical protein
MACARSAEDISIGELSFGDSSEHTGSVGSALDEPQSPVHPPPTAATVGGGIVQVGVGVLTAVDDDDDDVAAGGYGSSGARWVTAAPPRRLQGIEALEEMDSPVRAPAPAASLLRIEGSSKVQFGVAGLEAADSGGEDEQDDTGYEDDFDDEEEEEEQEEEDDAAASGYGSSGSRQATATTSAVPPRQLQCIEALEEMDSPAITGWAGKPDVVAAEPVVPPDRTHFCSNEEEPLWFDGRSVGDTIEDLDHSPAAQLGVFAESMEAESLGMGKLSLADEDLSIADPVVRIADELLT